MRWLDLQLGNLLGRSGVIITVSDVDALFPVANLYDGLPSRKFKYGSNGANRLFTADLNNILNPGFETSTLASWIEASSGGGLSAETMAGGEVHSGVKAMRLNGGGAGIGKRSQDILVRAGELRTLEAAIRGDGTASARIQLQDLTSGKYLQPGGASWGAAADLFTRSTAAYAVQTVSYQVESWLALGKNALTTLRLICYVNQNGNGFFDSFVDSATWNFLAVIGHNVTPAVVPQWRSSNDAFAADDVLHLAPTPLQPSFFGYLSAAVAKRYVRFTLAGTNPSTPEHGEVILGYIRTAGRGLDYGSEMPRELPQLRSAGGEYVFPLAQKPRRGLAGSLRQGSAAGLLEAEEMVDRCAHGAHPIVIVPRDSEDLVVYGRLEPEWSPKLQSLSVWDAPLNVRPFPLAANVS